MLFRSQISPQVTTEAISQTPTQTPAFSTNSTPMTVSDEGAFVKWLKEDWLQKLGSLLLLIGLGWFTTYAFMNNWIGPVGRITLGLILGLVVLVLGHFRIKKYLNQG